MRTLSVVIPAYNEERGIAQIVERVLATRDALSRIGWDMELLVVDDGSEDRTASVVTGYPDVRVIRHARNRGYGAAIKTGFRTARGDYLAFLDADGTYPPEAFPDLCRAAIEQDADVVVGSRMSGARSEMPLTRRVGNIAFATMLSMIGNVSVRDTASGQRVLRRSVLPLLYPLPDGLQFTPAMSTRAIHENLHIVEVPIAYSERVGRSKLSVVRDGMRFTRAIVWTALAYNPVRVLGIGSLGLFGGAGLVGLYILALRLSGVTSLAAQQVFLVFTAVLLLVAGISLFTLGAMFNYLVALFHQRPMRQGMFGKPLFNPPLDHQFGWIGAVAIAAGTILGFGSFVASLGGWETTRLWFYLLISVALVVVGIQLLVAWIVMRVLEELAQREAAAQLDLSEPVVAAAPGTAA